MDITGVRRSRATGDDLFIQIVKCFKATYIINNRRFNWLLLIVKTTRHKVSKAGFAS